MKNHGCTVGDVLHDIVPVRNQIAEFDRDRSGVLQFLDMLLQCFGSCPGLQNLLFLSLLLLQTAGNQKRLQPQQRKKGNPEEIRLFFYPETPF